jgi:hypothetical protein
MPRGHRRTRSRPGWERHAETSRSHAELSGRRWRILHGARPASALLEPAPPWVHNPEQFVEWLSLRLGPAELRRYFCELESIARRSCDLELLRFSRRYQAQLRGAVVGPGAAPRRPNRGEP